MSRIPLAAFVCGGLVLALAAGCGPTRPAGEHPVYPATGQVLYKNQPLAGAYVGFHPDKGDLPGAYGTTDAQGRFRLTTYNQHDGAVAGKHNVVVKKTEGGSEPREIEPGVLDPNFVPTEPKSLIPRRYDSPATSKLAAEVTAAGPNDFSFKLE